MENIFMNLLMPKCFSILAYIMNMLHLFSGVKLSRIASNIRSGEKGKFSCDVGENAPVSDKTYIETACFSKYDQIYNSPLPFYGFVQLSYAAVLAAYIVHFILVKSSVDEVEKSDQAQYRDDEKENQAERVNQQSHFVYYSYVIHLFIRFVLGVSFTVLQYTVFYPMGFDSEFTCDLEAEAESTSKGTTKWNSKQFNFTCTNCYSSTGSEKVFWSKTVASLNILFALIALVEAIYLVYTMWRYQIMYERFENEFCYTYLLRKSRQHTSIMHTTSLLSFICAFMIADFLFSMIS